MRIHISLNARALFFPGLVHPVQPCIRHLLRLPTQLVDDLLCAVDGGIDARLDDVQILVDYPMRVTLGSLPVSAILCEIIGQAASFPSRPVWQVWLLPTALRVPRGLPQACWVPFEIPA